MVKYGYTQANAVCVYPFFFFFFTIGDKTTVETINLFTPSSYKPALTVKSGAAVGTITYDSADASTIVIEDGATVGSIIYNGETYTLEQWRKR